MPLRPYNAIKFDSTSTTFFYSCKQILPYKGFSQAEHRKLGTIRRFQVILAITKDAENSI
jgi:hypothetical protein